MQQERVRGGEKLVFGNSQEAQVFRESVEGRIDSGRGDGTARPREIVAEELAKKFEEHGVAVASLHTPWEHTQEEHAEVQDLVNIAFADDLRSAINAAEKSGSFPRNIDLLHDVLTGELYDAVVQGRVNTVHVSSRALLLAVVPIALLIAAILVFAYSL